MIEELEISFYIDFVLDENVELIYIFDLVLFLCKIFIDFFMSSSLFGSEEGNMCFFNFLFRIFLNM